MILRRTLYPLVACVIFASINGCSIRKLAVNKLADALAGGGSTFASDNDPDLIGAALPFSLKLMENLLSESPKHAGLLRAASSGFTQYTYAFVQQEADEIETKDFAAAEALRGRARRLYIRARNYGLRGLDAVHKGFSIALSNNPRDAVQVLKKSDVPEAYWTAVAWAASIALSKDDPVIVGEIPQMEALIDRALVLDEAWGDGAIHAFLISYEMSRTGVAGDAAERSKKHLERAVQLSRGEEASPWVAFAEDVCTERQDAVQFEEMLRRALAVNPDANPEDRVVNLIMQRRARWLLSREEDLFLRPVKPGNP